ncbi:hypothetical protein ACQPYK_14375 [Streptosporangium sp. CA-135522]|uniref:hypothetical protein n=1 Tax=Streptosporangium sp. CA-135522 TaxID=3240072 RepID=UPI003D93FB32
MKGFLELAGMICLVQAVGGTVNTLLGWWGWAHGMLLVNRLAFLEGYEIFTGIVLGVLGLALCAAASAVHRD